MKTFKISIQSPKVTGLFILDAVEADVAVKRLLGGGYWSNFKFASVSDLHRVKMARGEKISLSIERTA